MDHIWLNFNFTGAPDPLQKETIPELHNREMEAELDSRIRILNRAAMVSISDVNGNILYANENFCKASGYSHDELIGHSHELLLHPDMPKSFYEDMRRTILPGKIWQGEVKHIARDGSPYWVKATVAPVLDADGKPLRFISVRFDITAQKNVEEELREAKKKIYTELHENVSYASHIHRNILPGEKDLHTLFPQSFLISRAQQIISGDFYWFGKKHLPSGNSRRFIAFGDSTGHGVAAAFISLLAVQTLARLGEQTDCGKPADLLWMLNKSMLRFIHPKEGVTMHGLAEAAFFCIDDKNLELRYASAHLRLLVLREGKIIDLYREAQAIGTENFTLEEQRFQLQTGDRVYVMSDGMYDQFGGERNKRFGSKRFKDLLASTSHLDMRSQREAIERSLAEWQNDQPQTDDMSMIGIEI